MTSLRNLPLLAAVVIVGAVLSFDAVTSRAQAVTTENSVAEANCLALAQLRGGIGLRAMTHGTSEKGLVTISLKGVGREMWTCIAHEDGTVSFLSRDRSMGR